MTSIVLISPVAEDFKPEFVGSMNDLWDAVAEEGWTVSSPRLLYSQGSLPVQGGGGGEGIVVARNRLAYEALTHTTAEWFVWADSDMQFRGELVVRMIHAGIATNEKLIGVAYPSRVVDQFVWWPGVERLGPLEERPRKHGMIEVDAIGFGLVVAHRSVFDAWSTVTKIPGKPIGDAMGLSWRSKDRSSYVGHWFRPIAEDRLFCEDWRQQGGKVHVMVDAEVGHIGRLIYRDNLNKHVAFR